MGPATVRGAQITVCLSRRVSVSERAANRSCKEGFNCPLTDSLKAPRKDLLSAKLRQAALRKGRFVLPVQEEEPGRASGPRFTLGSRSEILVPQGTFEALAMAFGLGNSEEQSLKNSYIACTERAVRGAPPGQRVFCRWDGLFSALTCLACLASRPFAWLRGEHILLDSGLRRNDGRRLCGLRASSPGREAPLLCKRLLYPLARSRTRSRR